MACCGLENPGLAYRFELAGPRSANQLEAAFVAVTAATDRWYAPTCETLSCSVSPCELTVNPGCRGSD